MRWTREALLVVPNEVFDGGLVGALDGARRTAFFVFLLLRWHTERDATGRLCERDGDLISTVRVAEIARLLAVDRRSVARALLLLERWGWIVRSGRACVLGVRDASGDAFYFDGWLATHIGRVKPTEGVATLRSRVRRADAVLKHAEAGAGPRPRAMPAPPRRYVVLSTASALLDTTERRGAALLCLLIKRARYLRSTTGGGHQRVARPGHALLSAMLGVCRDTTHEWVRLAKDRGELIVLPGGPRKRTGYQTPAPEGADAFVARVAVRSGSSQAALELLRSSTSESCPVPSVPRSASESRPARMGHCSDASMTREQERADGCRRDGREPEEYVDLEIDRHAGAGAPRMLATLPDEPSRCAAEAPTVPSGATTQPGAVSRAVGPSTGPAESTSLEAELRALVTAAEATSPATWTAASPAASEPHHDPTPSPEYLAEFARAAIVRARLERYGLIEESWPVSHAARKDEPLS